MFLEKTELPGGEVFKTYSLPPMLNSLALLSLDESPFSSLTLELRLLSRSLYLRSMKSEVSCAPSLM